MKFHLDTAEVYIPDGLPVEQALARTTHLCFSAHQDDIEIMAAQPILECFQQKDKWFTGVVVTDGRGSPRNGLYEKYSDDEMRLVRFKEQRKAAIVGEFAAQVMLDYPKQDRQRCIQNRACGRYSRHFARNQAAVCLYPQPGGQARYACRQSLSG